MPANKYINFRIKILDRCFSDFNNRYTFDDLHKIVRKSLYEHYYMDVSVRQLRGDLKTIREMLPYDVELKTYPLEGKLCYYRYSKTNFSIYKNELSPQDVESLRSTIEMLSKYRGLPNNSWLEDVISNLEIRFGIKPKADNVVSFANNEELKGSEFLSDLITAAIEQQTLEIVYKPNKDKEYHHTLHPYFLKQYNERWFLFGLDDKERRIKNLALDRIHCVSESHVAFVKNDFVDFNTCFDNVVGVTIPQEQELVEIHLKFTPHRFRYVTSKKIHKSQEVISNENCIISICVYPTRELEQQIFSFGPDVEVLSPAWYRQDFSKKIEDCMKKYLSMQNPCTDTL